MIFTFLNSLGTGLVMNGIFFVAKSMYSFADTSNYLLGMVMGVAYIVGAAGAGGMIARLRTRFAGLNGRGILIAVMLLLGATCLFPLAGVWLASLGIVGGPWAVWTLVICYSLVTGVLWPMTEAYLSGGKSGAGLRHDVGLFNVVWSSAVVLSFWSLSPLIERFAIEALTGMAAIHLLLAFYVFKAFQADPAPHIHAHDEPHPPVYGQLLVVLRRLLPLAYVISSVLAPYLPGAMEQLSVTTTYQPLVASAWLAPRVVAFFLLQHWHGWQGKWALPVAGTTMLVLGFAVAVLSPLGLSVGMSKGACIGAMMAGLACFGLGKATIYAGALYYAMEVGAAEVDAGGTHEALIGVGYLVGPLCGLAPLLAVQAGYLPQRWFQLAVILSVTTILIGVLASLMPALFRRGAVRPMA